MDNFNIDTGFKGFKFIFLSNSYVSHSKTPVKSRFIHATKSKLTINEVFFFAAMIHLVFVKIHPWNDGNGRSARLIEKWFLAQKLGDKAWFVQSEKKYYQQHQTYYKNILLLGLEYLDLDYSQALPFLLMLPNSISSK